MSRISPETYKAFLNPDQSKVDFRIESFTDLPIQKLQGKDVIEPFIRIRYKSHNCRIRLPLTIATDPITNQTYYVLRMNVDRSSRGGAALSRHDPLTTFGLDMTFVNMPIRNTDGPPLYYLMKKYLLSHGIHVHTYTPEVDRIIKITYVPHKNEKIFSVKDGITTELSSAQVIEHSTKAKQHSDSLSEKSLLVRNLQNIGRDSIQQRLGRLLKLILDTPLGGPDGSAQATWTMACMSNQKIPLPTRIRLIEAFGISENIWPLEFKPVLNEYARNVRQKIDKTILDAVTSGKSPLKRMYVLSGDIAISIFHEIYVDHPSNLTKDPRGIFLRRKDVIDLIRQITVPRTVPRNEIGQYQENKNQPAKTGPNRATRKSSKATTGTLKLSVQLTFLSIYRCVASFFNQKLLIAASKRSQELMNDRQLELSTQAMSIDV